MSDINKKIAKITPKWVEDFKAFAIKGNVIDLAVAVVVGGAFNKIVSSLVSDIIMPLIGALTGGIDFSGLVTEIGEAKITYGLFIQSIVDFLIIALSIFFAVRLLGKLHTPKKDEAPAEPAVPSEDIVLLREIRDALVKKD